MKSWLKSTENGFMLTLYIQPGARKTEVCGEYGEALKIRLAAPPVEGKANHALIHWLAEHLDVPRRNITLYYGEKSRHKTIIVVGIQNESIILSRLGA